MSRNEQRMWATARKNPINPQNFTTTSRIALSSLCHLITRPTR